MIKVRIAPSPTGDPHVGTAYVALFNYVFAKQNKGRFVLRVEDTDQARYSPTSEAAIMNSLKWLGVSWDEGPDVGGPCGPYRQSERLAIYKEHAHMLVDQGAAYYCFCTSQRLDSLRKKQTAAKMQPKYDRCCLALSAEEIKQKLSESAAHVIRMKIPEGQTAYHDALRGDTVFENRQLDDQILMKSDGYPTYHLANVVDDHLMGITHVIRAEEWISSTPKHALLYRAYGWQEPEFYHLPLLRNPDKSKISKRKNPTSIEYYQALGILPQAMINFLALQGWAHPEQKDVFSLEELTRFFDIGTISLGGPVFDLKKLFWINGQHLRAMDIDAWTDTVRDYHFTRQKIRALAPLVQERMETLSDFLKWARSFFTFDVGLNSKDFPLNKIPLEDAIRCLQDAAAGMDGLPEWTHEALEAFFKNYAEANGMKPKDLYMLIRFAFYGDKSAPPLFQGMAIMNKAVVQYRLSQAVLCLKQMSSPKYNPQNAPASK